MTAAPFALLNATVFLNGSDISGDTNQVTVNATVAEKDNTTFGNNGYMSRIPGLRDFQLTHAGYVNYGAAGAEDSELFSEVGQTNIPVTITPHGTDGDIAYFGHAIRATFLPLDAAVGDVAAFSGTIDGSGGVTGLRRGQLLLPKQTLSSTANGTIQQLGAVSSTQFLHAVLHVFAAGTTVTVIVQSATTSGFGSPSTRATFSAVTTVGGTIAARVAGPITDQYWRMAVSAITGSFTLAGAVSIQ